MVLAYRIGNFTQKGLILHLFVHSVKTKMQNNGLCKCSKNWKRMNHSF